MMGLTRPPFFKEHEIAYERMVGKKVFALFPDTGTAKTFMLLRDFLAMWQADMVDGLLVIAPVDVHRQWIEEELPAVTDIKCVTAAWPELPPLERTNRPRIFAIYPEAFRRTKHVWELCKKFLQSGRIGMVVDESQMIMNARSKTSRRIRALKPYTHYRRVASGFPNPKGLIDLYPQYSFLNTTILNCTTKSQFVERFCVLGGFKGKQIVGDKNVDEFNRLVAKHTYTIELDKCTRVNNHVPMPERKWATVPVELSDEQRRLIEQVKKEFRAVLDEDTIVMPMALQRLTRIQQLACGFLPKLDNKGKPTGELHIIKEYRTRALENTLNSIRGKVVVWSRFTHCTDRLTKHFGEQAVRYRGGMDRHERAHNKERFMRDPKCLYLFAQPQSLGTGANGLTVSRHTLYWSNDFNALIRRQTERRIWRIGQSKECWYGDLIAKGTYDERIRSTLISRQNVAGGILADIAAWAENEEFGPLWA